MQLIGAGTRENQAPYIYTHPTYNPGFTIALLRHSPRRHVSALQTGFHAALSCAILTPPSVRQNTNLIAFT